MQLLRLHLHEAASQSLIEFLSKLKFYVKIIMEQKSWTGRMVGMFAWRNVLSVSRGEEGSQVSAVDTSISFYILLIILGEN